MNGSLGRDRVWNQQIWSDIDKAVQEEVCRIRVAQKVFPSTVVNNVLPVSMNRAVPFGAPAPAPGDDAFQPFFEISTEFVLTQAQVDGNLQLALSRARMAASALAIAEDTILFLGPGFALPGGVTVTNLPAIPPGFVDEAVNYPPFTSVVGAAAAVAAARGRPAVPAVLGDILAAVANGMATLDGRAQPGPYALFLSPDRYGQTFAPGAGLLKGPGDQINRKATGGFHMVSSLAVGNLAALAARALPFLPVVGRNRIRPPSTDIGILVSLGGEPAKIIIGTDATTAFTHTDALGNYHFRVFERIQMVVQDGRAFQGLSFP